MAGISTCSTTSCAVLQTELNQLSTMPPAFSNQTACFCFAIQPIEQKQPKITIVCHAACLDW